MRHPWRWIVGLLVLGFLILLAILPGGAKQQFEVAGEFQREVLIKLPTVGPFDLSVTKTVAYLWLTVAVVVVVAIAIARSLKLQPGRFQYAMEAMYELARDGIVGGVMKSGKKQWFPYIGGAFFFVLTCNLIGLIPLPFGEHHQTAFYAATANLNVTLMLALCTFLFTHYAGVRKNGALRYVKAWAPSGAPPVLKQIIWLIHVVSEIFRLISLSVRLFANMVAGHAILAVFFAMALIFQSYLVGLALQGASVLIYMFEIFVAFIQAFIFAILSAVYIGGALDQDH
ncbi:MAG TPA: F0F1 ATP synthase subunit A [Thermoleophilia bacterium]|nr:F0F1 ATP synthase subunit A [Thermoleophilia bacterium]